MAAQASSSGYAGDLDPDEAWALLEKEPKAQIVDVRTLAEWNFVGVPDASQLDRQAIFVEWQLFPSMTPNQSFVQQAMERLKEAGADPEAPVLFLCRSGVRSRAAAIAMTNAGFTRAYNIAHGFEGDLDPERHRGHQNGWKASGLPWKQT